MLRQLKLSLPVLMLCFILIPSVYAAGEWKNAKNKHGISVFTRDIEGSDIDEFMGKGLINAPLERVNMVLDDIPRLKDWMPNCLKSILVSKKSNTFITIYYELKTPWPLSNRDVVFSSKVIIKKDRIIRTVYAVKHPAVPEKKGIVRMTEMVGKWVLMRKGDKTHATYWIKSNPAGSLPTSIANMASKTLPYETIKKLRTQVKLPQYQ